MEIKLWPPARHYNIHMTPQECINLQNTQPDNMARKHKLSVPGM